MTDPPYNVDYEGYTEDRLTINGDKMTAAQFQQFLLATFSSYRRIVKPGASMYVRHSSSWQREFQNSMESAGFEARCQIIWARNTIAWGFGRYKFQHEPIFYAHVGGQKDAWYGDKSQSTLWHEKRPRGQAPRPAGGKAHQRADVSCDGGRTRRDYRRPEGSPADSIQRRGDSATPKQAADLELIKGCKFGREPGGAQIVELLQCFYAGPVKQTNEIREQA